MPGELKPEEVRARVDSAFDGICAELLLTRVEDPESNAHSENERVHLGELRNCCVNEGMMLAHLAARS